MSKRDLSSDEAHAWSRVARSIKRIDDGAADDFEALLKELDSPSVEVPAKQKAPKAPLNTPQTAPKLHQTARKGIADRGHEKRVKRGKIAIAATFDLHGHTQATAARILPGFLIGERQAGARCVLIITGKGKMGEGVLRRNFLDWINSPAARPIVSGFAEAHQRHGGAGAFYVFLRKPD